MDKDFTRIQDDWRCLMDLSTELLVIIMSHLSVCDKIKMRYVCRRFKDVSEIPLLWKEFVWPDCEPRHVRSVSSLLEVCGEHVRRIFYPAHLAPVKILEMVQCCKKVTHLSLPTNTELSLKHLDEVVHTMTHLEELDVYTSGRRHSSPKTWFPKRGCRFTNGLLRVTATTVIKKLKLRIEDDGDTKLVLISIQDWARRGYPLPSVIDILTDDVTMVSVRLFEFWSVLKSSLSSFEICLYEIRKVPMNLYRSMPLRKFQFGPATTPPFVKLSDHGILGLKHDPFYLHDYDHYGEIRHTATPEYDERYNLFIKKEHLNYINNLHSVSDVNFSCVDIHSNNLEQLAVACPNLQQLNIMRNVDCLKDLCGLRAIVQTCKNLEGLNLLGISVSMVESCLLLWEMLSSLKKLTHLAVNLSLLEPYDVSTLQHCHSLQALEVHADVLSDAQCCTYNLLFVHFPSLVHCRMFGFRSPGLKSALANCCQLKFLYEDCRDYLEKTPLLPICCHLQQLYIHSSFNVTDEFMDVLSAHGGLECVVLYVRSITINGIANLIKNSPNLILLHISIKQPPSDNTLKHLRYTDYPSRIEKMLPYHKLFSAGNFKVYWLYFYEKDTTQALLNANLNSLWNQYDIASYLRMTLAMTL